MHSLIDSGHIFDIWESAMTSNEWAYTYVYPTVYRALNISAMNTYMWAVHNLIKGGVWDGNDIVDFNTRDASIQ